MEKKLEQSKSTAAATRSTATHGGNAPAKKKCLMYANGVVQDIDSDTLILPIKARVRMGEYEQNGVKIPYIHIGLVDPFGDEDFVDTRLKFKWPNDRGIFEHKTKKVLKTCESFEVSGEIRPSSFLSKRTKLMTTVGAIYIKNPFFVGEMEMQVKDAGLTAVFVMLLSDKWKFNLGKYDYDSANDESISN